MYSKHPVTFTWCMQGYCLLWRER